MRLKLQLIKLTFHRTPLLFLAPIIVAYGILPLVAITSVADLEKSFESVIYAEQTFLPISSLLWPMAYLQIRIESDGEEAMRVCYKGKCSSHVELALLYVGFLIMLAPVFWIASIVYDSVWVEYIRVCSQVLFTMSSFYVMAVLLHSVTMGGMLLAAYVLFCVFFSRDAGMRTYCLICPNSAAISKDLISVYFPLMLISVILFHIGSRIEKRFWRG